MGNVVHSGEWPHWTLDAGKEESTGRLPSICWTTETPSKLSPCGNLSVRSASNTAAYRLRVQVSSILPFFQSLLSSLLSPSPFAYPQSCRRKVTTSKMRSTLRVLLPMLLDRRSSIFMASRCDRNRRMTLWARPSPCRERETAAADCYLDPLNWNKWFKLWVLLQVAFLAFLGPFSQAVIVSAACDTHAQPLTSIELGLRPSGQVPSHQRCRGILPDHRANCVRRRLPTSLVTHRKRIRTTTDLHLRLRHWHCCSRSFRRCSIMGWNSGCSGLCRNRNECWDGHWGCCGCRHVLHA